MSKITGVPRSFVYAYAGVKEAIKNEPNFRVHIAVGTVALAAGVFFRLQPDEWLILLLTVCLVIILELLNTAIEALVDLASPEIHPKAKVAKDVAAAAVLLAAFTSVVVGVVLFLPKLLTVLNR